MAAISTVGGPGMGIRALAAGTVCVLLTLSAPALAQLYLEWSWGESALYKAVGDGELEDILAVGKVRKKPDWKDARGATALMYAAGMGRNDLVEELLSRGADVNATDRFGQNAFHYACGSMAGASFPSPETIRYLATVGEVTSKSSQGRSQEEVVPLCLIGAGSGDWAGTSYEGLHYREDEASDLVVVLFGEELSPEARSQLEEELGYPTTEPDPRGLLVSVNEAGIFPAVLH